MGELRIDPARLRRIGTYDVPDEAEYLGSVAKRLDEALGSLDVVTALAGDPRALRSMLRVGSDVYEEMRETVEDLNNIAVALVLTADDFQGTDDQAAQQYQDLTPTPLPPDVRDREDRGATDGAGEDVESTPDAIDPDDFDGPR